MKGIVQAVKRRMHKEDKISQELRSSSGLSSDKKKGSGDATAATPGTSTNTTMSSPIAATYAAPVAASSSNQTNTDHSTRGPLQSTTSSTLGSNISLSLSPRRSTSPTAATSAFTANATNRASAITRAVGSGLSTNNAATAWTNPPVSRQPTALPGAVAPVSSPAIDIDGIFGSRMPGPTAAAAVSSPFTFTDSIPAKSRTNGPNMSAPASPSQSASRSAASNPDQKASPSDLDSAGPTPGSPGIIFPPGVVFEGNPFAELPVLRETPQHKRLELFRKKLQLCSIVFDFTMQSTFLKEKEIKRSTLCELVEYVNNAMQCFNEQIMPDIVNMVAINIFRSLPPSSNNFGLSAVYEPEEDEPRLESSWPHLQIVYEFFRRFVVSPDTDSKVAKRYIEQTFILKLLKLFSSEDPRERDYLKTILHRIYGKIMAMRSFIRKSVQHLFFEAVYEREIQHGTAELLEILGSIVNGFALPLKEEHKLFLEKALIPLHKPRNFVAYHQYLAYCMSQYVEKDSRLAEPIVLGLLKYWPVTNTTKEVLFINEVEEVLELTQMPEFRRVMIPLFQKLSQCIQSSHFQVAERVLFLWNNDHVVTMINDNRSQLFPIVIKALYKNSREHWNSTVNSLTYNVSKLLAQADPVLFDDCSDKHISSEEKQKQQELKRSRFWIQLQSAYESRGESEVVERNAK